MTTRIYARTTTPGTVKNRVLTQLQNEGERLIQQMREQLVRDLLRQSEALFSAAASGKGDVGIPDLGNFTSLISSAAKYIMRQQPALSSQESTRSIASRQQFRLSQSQAAQAANSALARAQKNA